MKKRCHNFNIYISKIKCNSSLNLLQINCFVQRYAPPSECKQGYCQTHSDLAYEVHQLNLPSEAHPPTLDVGS